jgi:hypothetical protein
LFSRDRPGTSIGADFGVRGDAAAAAAAASSSTVVRDFRSSPLSGGLLLQLAASSLRDGADFVAFISPDPGARSSISPPPPPPPSLAGDPPHDRAGDPAPLFVADASPTAAARTPPRFVCALCQNALNSNGCKYRRPYTNLPAGRCASSHRVGAPPPPPPPQRSVKNDASEDHDEEYALAPLRSEHALGERLRERSVDGDTDRAACASGVEGDTPNPKRLFEPESRRGFAKPAEAFGAACDHFGGHDVAALAPDRVHVTTSVPVEERRAGGGNETSVELERSDELGRAGGKKYQKISRARRGAHRRARAPARAARSAPSTRRTPARSRGRARRTRTCATRR